jgi:hypothetical protein
MASLLSGVRTGRPVVADYLENKIYDAGRGGALTLT